MFSIFVAVGAVAQLQLGSQADLMNCLMAIASLIGLQALSNVIVAETKKHFANEKT